MITIKIINTQFNVFFPKNTQVRQRVFDLETKLSEQFQTPFNLIPVPDDAPPEIPRIVAMSKRGHSQLSISLGNAGLITTYDENYNANWDLCRDYIERRVENYIPVIEELSSKIFLYSGLLVKIDLPFEDDPVQLLIDKFLNLKSFNKPFDIEMKLTFTVEDVYYINLTFSNQRTYDGISAPDNFTPAYLSLQGESIGVLVDINDRYGFNYIKGYKSNLEKQKYLFELTTIVLKEKLPEIIEIGEFHL